MIANQALAGFAKTETLQSVLLHLGASDTIDELSFRPGTTVTVTIPIVVNDLAIWGASDKWTLEAGKFSVRLASASDTILFSKS